MSDSFKVQFIIESLAYSRCKNLRSFRDELDIRAPIEPLFRTENQYLCSDNNNSYVNESIEDTEIITKLLKELANLHYEWAIENYKKVRNNERFEHGKNNTSQKEEIIFSPYLKYLSSQYDGVDSPIIKEIISCKQGYVVMECILLSLNQHNSIQYGNEHFKKYSGIMLLLSDILRSMKKQKTLNYYTMDFRVLIDILFREMVIMRDSGFALFEYVSCLNIVIKCIASTEDKYHWGEATTLLSVTESLIEGFGVIS